MKKLARYLRYFKKEVILGPVFKLTEAIFELIVPLVMAKIIDVGIANGNTGYIYRMGCVLILLGVVGLSCALVCQYMASKASQGVGTMIRNELFAHINTLSHAEVDKLGTSSLVNRITNDVNQIQVAVAMLIRLVVRAPFLVIGATVMAMMLDLKLSVIFWIAAVLVAAVLYLVMKQSIPFYRVIQKKLDKIGLITRENLEGVRVIRAFSKQYVEKERFANANEDHAQTAVRVGQLSCFLSYANQYTKPFNEITGVITELQTAIASARRVFTLLDEPVESSDAELPVLTDCDGTVALDHVDFSYRPETPLIEDLNLSVQAGQRIAIVGPTGCGKTTIINLLMRFYDVTGGEIRLSGHPVQAVTRSSLRRQYGMVLQETWLFHGTIRDNIAYGNEQATEEEIMAAAKLAHAHSFIKRLDQGYDTVISEDGENISQGQKQLLCIARIMLTHPPMLILDEATSSIDTRTEVRIQKAFAKMMEGRTSFIVAHRLSTIREADVILVMNNGHVIEQGNHQELLAKGGFYARLYNSQFEQS